MLDLANYISGIEFSYIDQGRKLPPFVKLISPIEWDYLKKEFNIDILLKSGKRNEIPVVKQIYKNKGKNVFTMEAVELKGQSYKTLFEEKAPQNLSLEEMAEEFWKRRATTHSKYAQGFENSLFPVDMIEG